MKKKLQSFQSLMLRPRYLRAIPSLMVLTTAMAWSVLPDSDAADVSQRRAGTSVSQAGPAIVLGLDEHLHVVPRADTQG